MADEDSMALTLAVPARHVSDRTPSSRMLPSVSARPAGRSGGSQRRISSAMTSKTVFLTLSGFTDVILAFAHGPSPTGTLMG
jgi:hypothetical protein